MATNKFHRNPSQEKPLRDHEFRMVNGRMQTVGLPRPIELKGLVSKFRIKPNTSPLERSILMADVYAAQSSLKAVN